MWQSLVAVAYKEVIHAKRNSFMLRAIVVSQFLQLVMLGFLDMTVKDLPTVIVDQSRTTEAREFVAKLRATNVLDVMYVTSSIGQAREDIRAGRATVAVVLPPDFHRGRLSGGRHVLTLVEGSDAASSNQAIAVVDGVAARAGVTVDRDGPVATISTHAITLYNPEGKNAFFTLPGLLAAVLMMSYTQLAGISLAREREMGNLERLLMTPIHYLGLMLGKMVPYCGLAFLNGVVYLLVIRWAFGVPCRGSVALMVLAVALYSATTLMVGMFFASKAKSVGEVFMPSMLLTTPTMFLSGVLLPLSSVPFWLKPVSYALPATHMIQITRGILLRNAGITDLAPNFVYLTLVPLGLAVLSARRFRTSIAE